jgi:hypothetical protein
LYVLKEVEMGKGYSRNGEKKTHRLLVPKPEGKNLVVRARRRWVDNNELDLEEIRWGRGDSICLAHDKKKWRTVMKLRVPKNAGKSWSGLTTGGLSSSAQHNIVAFAHHIRLARRITNYGCDW